MTRFKETKYLTFASEIIKGRKTKTVYIINKSNINCLGTIEWYGTWRQYCFIPTAEFETVWNNTCLTDVLEVINMLMKERQTTK